MHTPTTMLAAAPLSASAASLPVSSEDTVAVVPSHSTICESTGSTGGDDVSAAVKKRRKAIEEVIENAIGGPSVEKELPDEDASTEADEDYTTDDEDEVPCLEMLRLKDELTQAAAAVGWHERRATHHIAAIAKFLDRHYLVPMVAPAAAPAAAPTASGLGELFAAFAVM